MLTVLLCVFYHLETISAEVSPDLSVLGPKCLDHFGISTEVSLDTGTKLVLYPNVSIPKCPAALISSTIGYAASNFTFMMTN